MIIIGISGIALAMAGQQRSDAADAVKTPAALAIPAVPQASGATAPSGGEVEALKPLDIQSWVSADDYPVEAIRMGAAGTVGFKLWVSEAGLVTDCEVTSSSGSPILDQTTCTLLRKRARFSPALVRRKAVPATFRSRFKWELPASPPPWNLEKPVAAHLTFDVLPDGNVSNCALEAEGAPTPPQPLCPSLEKIPAPLLDYLRGGAKAPVTIAADFTIALQGAAPLPAHAPRPGVVTFAHLNFDAEPTPAGRPHCIVKAAWGDYKASMEFPCPREMQKAFGGKTQILRMVMTLGSSGPAPDPEGLGPIIKLMKAKNRAEASDETVPASPETQPAPPAGGPKTAGRAPRAREGKDQ